jgi:hypothetical protein
MALCVQYQMPHSKLLRWDQSDRDKAIAYQRWMSEQCPRCGTREADWKDDRYAYVVHTHHCPGCELLETEGRQEEEEREPGVSVVLLPYDLALAVEGLADG